MKDQENWKYIKLACAGIAVVLVGVGCYFLIEKVGAIQTGINEVARILMPFVYGAVIAYLLAPACNWFEKKLLEFLGENRKKMAEALAIVLSLILALLVLWALVMLVIPQLVTSVLNLVETMPQKVQDTNAWFNTLLEDQPQLQKYWEAIYTQIFSKVQETFSDENIDKLMETAQALLNNVVNVVNALLDFIIGIIVSVYFLAERKKFLAQAKLALYATFKKKWADLISDEVAYADMMFGGFIIGKILDSAIIGMICFVCVSIMGLPSAALISAIVGVTNVIPFFGPFIGAIPCAFLLLLESPLYCLYFVIFIIVLQQVDGNIIGPKILGDTTGLSSFWVLFAILLFGGKWGLVGMVIGVPLFAVIYDILRRIILRGLRKNQQEDLLLEYNHTFGVPQPGEETAAKSPRSRKEKKQNTKR